MEYSNVCWNCGDEISSRTNVRCEICGWYICNRCSACRQGECFSFFATEPKVRKYLRSQYNINPVPPIEFPSWCKKTLEEKRRKENQAAKVQEERESLQRAQTPEYEEKLLLLLQQKPNVTHIVFGKGTVLSTEEGYRTTHLFIKFDEYPEEKCFDVPDAFQKGFLTVDIP